MEKYVSFSIQKENWKGCFIMLLEGRGLTQIIVKLRAENLCVHSNHQKIILLRSMVYQLQKQLYWKWGKAHFILLHNLVHDFWKKISQGVWFFTVVHASTKSLNETHTKFFQLLNYTFMWTSDFYWYEHVYTYRRRQEFQNIPERKLCNCFGQLLLIY